MEIDKWLSMSCYYVWLPVLNARFPNARRCAALSAAACVPPPFKEPLLDRMTTSLVQEMLVHDSKRIHNPAMLINTVVYDCLEPSPCWHDDAVAAMLREEVLPPTR